MPSVSELAYDDDDLFADSYGDEIAPAVKIEDLWITYRAQIENDASLKDRLLSGKKVRRFREIEAIRGISFEVASGSVYGVIGHNGAG